jgi:acyl-CoA reductase-like NAD-dependent aldehyde dehydrogenase
MALTVLNYIDGQWCPCASGKTFDSHNPANGEKVAVAQDSGISDTDLAIQAARRAFDQGPWRSMAGAQRAAILNRLADLMESEADSLAGLIALEMGKPVRTAMDREVLPTIDRVRFFAAAARMIRGEVTDSAPRHLLNIIRKVPVGVCALIVPWNDPIDLVIRKLGAALAAGCTVVVKPASHCPASTMEMFRLMDKIEGLPPGVVNVVTGRGSLIGEHLAKNPGVDKVSFTGGTTTGRRIVRHAAGNLKKLSMECGGKSPFVLFADANLEKALAAVTYAAFAYAGQSCSAITRLIVERSIHADFLEKLIAAAGKRVVGDPADEASQIGPLVSEKQMNRVLDYIDTGRREGARLVCGGHRLTEGELSRGYYVGPTIFDAVTPAMTLAREEIFGPVLCVLPFDDEEEAIRMANSTPYGLAGAVWSADVNRCLRVSNAIEVGDVWINTYYVRLPESPYGGLKESGFGSELGMQGIEEYMVLKRYCFDTSPEFHSL